MILTRPEDYLKLVTVDKDVNLGKYIPDYSLALFQDALRNKISDSLPKDAAKNLFDKIYEEVDKAGMINHTNIEIHFAIRKDSMVQFVTPYTKDYKVGATHKFIHEKVIWSYRPEYVHIGYVRENTFTDEKTKGVRESNSHQFGSVEEYWNTVALYTHELNETKKGKKEMSTVHIAVFIPVSDEMFKQISIAYQRKMMVEKDKKKKK